ncbi:jasmonic acid-amido synthetase JAR2 [Sorghum bicolor]|uniref:jasmonic acid-amido synthetase JAR2 n=1 Tax=Sorghum bicolor TaxID=4558 RepID=UPI000B424BBB|nr:jasmonic acid-amido synthetase JAR2 [Sorghum bicolor]|eukprot:XP_021317680.1 jasmonic acid-amido synthetase JAR2 [Sorghum bicolor]
MQIYRTSYAFRNRAFPVEDGKALQFIYGSRQFTTTGGLTATTATTNVYRSEEFMPTMVAIQSQVCSPEAVIFGADFAHSLYCHLLYADEVRIVSRVRHLRAQPRPRVADLGARLGGPVRRHPRGHPLRPPRASRPPPSAGPIPALADEVARRCAGLSNWYGVIPALFPNARYVHGIMTGSMEHYVKKLRHYAPAGCRSSPPSTGCPRDGSAPTSSPRRRRSPSPSPSSPTSPTSSSSRSRPATVAVLTTTHRRLSAVVTKVPVESPHRAPSLRRLTAFKLQIMPLLLANDVNPKP